MSSCGLNNNGNGKFLLIIGLIILIVFIFIFFIGRESFNIPEGSSSAWDWNVGPGYGAGYGTGYAMWGIWPSNIKEIPWRNWMWGRRPSTFVTPFTPVPSIDYNTAPPLSNPIYNYNINLGYVGTKPVILINGFPNKTLYLIRNRDYYFHFNTSGIIVDNGSMKKTFDIGTFKFVFKNDDPNIIKYYYKDYPETGGLIYLV